MALSTQTFLSILDQTAADMELHVEELRQLDSQLGDGDLGITIDLACKALHEFLSSSGTDDIGRLLLSAAAKINQANPSTFGTLLSSGFMGAGKAAMGKTELVPGDLVPIGKGAIAGIQKLGKADLGDKTLLDALIPAVNGFESALAANESVETALHSAVAAAKNGMEATVAMRAKFGRANWHQEKSIGVQDAGATAVYFAIESFIKNLLASGIAGRA